MTDVSGMETSKSVIDIQDLSFAYETRNVLSRVNLKIREREFTCIVGPNGGGKSTLLKLLLGLIRPTKGSVQVFGTRPERARDRIGYYPQHARIDPQFPITVLDVVLMGRLGSNKLFGFFSKSDKQAASRALNQVDMLDKKRSSFGSLSGGQRQRILIARALAADPEMLLLDEPTASLDPQVEASLYDLLHKLSRHLTVVLVSHDLGFVSQHVHTVVCVNRSVIVHPTQGMKSMMISDIYGGRVRMVKHDHACEKENL